MTTDTRQDLIDVVSVVDTCIHDAPFPAEQFEALADAILNVFQVSPLEPNEFGVQVTRAHTTAVHTFPDLAACERFLAAPPLWFDPREVESMAIVHRHGPTPWVAVATPPAEEPSAEDPPSEDPTPENPPVEEATPDPEATP